MMFNSSPPRCHVCGVIHYMTAPCPSFTTPTADVLVTGSGEEEDNEIRRWNTMSALAEAAALAAAKSASMARLERELEHL